ncbi:MAG: signal peptide peptidase SppA [Bacteroidetes bacterium]|nr:MAG: signal peptide peptidase SppA [Bacteroidota bacterium]
MKNFIKYTIASLLGTLLTFLVILFIFIGIVAVVSAGDEKEVVVKDNSVLKLKLGKSLIDRQPINPLAKFGIGDDEDLVGMNRIFQVLEAAKEDTKIKGIYIDTRNLPGGGIANYSALRKALLDFKSSGKFIYAYGEYYSQKDYYIASIADKIVLNPVGAVDFKGLAAQIMFFKKAMEKLDIEMQIIRGPNNKFKSAVEPFMYDQMSEANKEQTEKFLSSLWESMLNDISTSRKLSIAQLQEIADSLSSSDSKTAKAIGLVDMIGYEDQFKSELMKKLDVTNDKKYNEISLTDYATTVKKANDFKKKNKIAVIYAVGEIISGEGNDEIIGSDRIAKAVRKARKDSSIKAIVLRINSPGGSALASEVMWRELVLAKEVKPVVVSMGNVAASGGYYIACMANKIIAEPTTITGSIGVFGMLPNLKKFFNDRLGLTFDGVNTNANSDMGSVAQPLTPFQYKVIQNSVVDIYTTFINHVAEGRNMTAEQVDAIGQGRVWSGVDAVKIGLVDELGGLDYAIAEAAKLANIEEYKITNRPELKDPIKEMLKNFGGGVKASVIEDELGASYKYYEYVKRMQTMEGFQTRLPFFIEIY